MNLWKANQSVRRLQDTDS